MKAGDLFREIGLFDIAEIFLVILLAWVAFVAIRRVLPLIADHVPGRLRLPILSLTPISRLLLSVLVLYWTIPIVFDVTLRNFLVVIGAVSVALGFAFKEYLSSIVAGVVAVFEKPYRPGDWIQVEQVYGEVLDVGMRAVRVRTADDDVVSIPHLKIWDSAVSNANDGSNTLMCVARFHVEPAHETALLRARLMDVALTSAWLKWGEPVLVIVQARPWGSEYQLKAYPFDMRDQFLFITDLTERGKQAIREAGARELQAGLPPPDSSARGAVTEAG